MKKLFALFSLILSLFTVGLVAAMGTQQSNSPPACVPVTGDENLSVEMQLSGTNDVMAVTQPTMEGLVTEIVFSNDVELQTKTGIGSSVSNSSLMNKNANAKIDFLRDDRCHILKHPLNASVSNHFV